jgi:pyruvate-ferredoxin/flavodoxin oxidoreductase
LLAIEKHREQALELIEELTSEINDAELINSIVQTTQKNDAEISVLRSQVTKLKNRLEEIKNPRAKQLLSVIDQIVKQSVWAIGGDGWAYDIGYGGLDHVLASGRNVNVLVVDTEVYSNTGGQASKATPMGAVAKFAASGKPMHKKDLGLISMTYGNIYVAQVAMVANATGCSSIYGANLPTTPYCTRKDGRGPAWSNSLFEDNAEFGFGMRLTADKMQEYAFEMLQGIVDNKEAPESMKSLSKMILDVDQKTSEGIEEARKLVAELKVALKESSCSVDCKECTSTAKILLSVADYIINKSVWVLGGDGWAYDIGYGGVDHVLASGRNIKILVVDTEVYSNTGGQASKATPMGAIAKFAASGKPQMKKNLGAISMTYKNIYVAQISMGANPAAAVKAIAEAEAYDGPAIVIAYSHCIAHGINMIKGLDQQKIAVQSGHFPLYRYNPALSAEGKNPLILDSKEPSISFAETAVTENRFKQLTKVNPNAEEMLKKAEQGFKDNFEMLKAIAALPKA